MRKNFAYGLSVAALLGVIVVVFGQPPTPTETPTPASTSTPDSTPTPVTPPVLISAATPTPTPTPVPTPTLTPNESGTVSVPSTLTSPSPSPSEPPISVQAAALDASSLGWSERGSPVFRIDQAVITALQQNPDVRRALEEIRRTKGVIIEIRAQALPHIGPSGTFTWTDPNLNEGSSFSTFGQVAPTPTPTPTPAGTPVPGTGMGGIKNLRSDISYNIKVTGTQLIFNGTTFPAIRGTFFQRDSAYFALRNTVDLIISTVK